MDSARVFVLLGALLLWSPLRTSQAAPAGMGDEALCRAAIANAETAQHVPDAFLAAIARVESGRVSPATGAWVAWPWTINVGGTGSFFASKQEAVAAVQALQARGIRSIDVGCLQVNLEQHSEAFASLEQAFDPQMNARYAAGLLKSLFAQTGSWPLAAAAYHSQTPVLGAAYQHKVLDAWAVPEGAVTRTASPRAAAGSASPPTAAAREAGAAGGAIGRPDTISPRPVVAFAPSGGLWPATGRGLAAYRAMPTRLALRPIPHAG